MKPGRWSPDRRVAEVEEAMVAEAVMAVVAEPAGVRAAAVAGAKVVAVVTGGATMEGSAAHMELARVVAADAAVAVVAVTAADIDLAQ
jgi:beta-phosphoglucomutase-like phosphatase (HAD superfamily)